MMVAHSPCSSPASSASSGETSVNSSGCSSARWDKRARHSARSVMLGEAIRRQHVREARIAGRLARRDCPAALSFAPEDWCAARYSGLANERLQRLVVRGQRAIFQSAGDVQPATPSGCRMNGSPRRGLLRRGRCQDHRRVSGAVICRSPACPARSTLSSPRPTRPASSSRSTACRRDGRRRGCK